MAMVIDAAPACCLRAGHFMRRAHATLVVYARRLAPAARVYAWIILRASKDGAFTLRSRRYNTCLQCFAELLLTWFIRRRTVTGVRRLCFMLMLLSLCRSLCRSSGALRGVQRHTLVTPVTMFRSFRR